MLAIKKTTGGNGTDLHQQSDERFFGGQPISPCDQLKSCHKRKAMCEPQVRERVIMSILYGLISLIWQYQTLEKSKDRRPRIVAVGLQKLENITPFKFSLWMGDERGESSTEQKRPKENFSAQERFLETISFTLGRQHC